MTDQGNLYTEHDWLTDWLTDLDPGPGGPGGPGGPLGPGGPSPVSPCMHDTY